MCILVHRSNLSNLEHIRQNRDDVRRLSNRFQWKCVRTSRINIFKTDPQTKFREVSYQAVIDSFLSYIIKSRSIGSKCYMKNVFRYYFILHFAAAYMTIENVIILLRHIRPSRTSCTVLLFADGRRKTLRFRCTSIEPSKPSFTVKTSAGLRPFRGRSWTWWSFTRSMVQTLLPFATKMKGVDFWPILLQFVHVIFRR